MQVGIDVGAAVVLGDCRVPVDGLSVEYRVILEDSGSLVVEVESDRGVDDRVVDVPVEPLEPIGVVPDPRAIADLLP